MLLTFSELDRLADQWIRIRVRKQVEDFLPGEAIGRCVLVDDARRDRDVVADVEGQRGAHARAVARVHVFLEAAVFLACVDEAAVLGRVTDDTQRGRVGQRHVDHALHMEAHFAVGHRIDVEFDIAFELVGVRLVGDVANRAADRTRAEQRALRATQRLDAVEVIKVEVRREQRQRDHRLVEIHADLLLDARLVANNLAGRYAADRDLALARTQVLDREARHVTRQFLEICRARALDVLRRLCVDRERHILDRALTLRRRDRDFFKHALGGRSRRDAEQRDGCRQHAQRACCFFDTAHVFPPDWNCCQAKSSMIMACHSSSIVLFFCKTRVHRRHSGVSQVQKRPGRARP